MPAPYRHAFSSTFANGFEYVDDVANRFKLNETSYNRYYTSKEHGGGGRHLPTAEER